MKDINLDKLEKARRYRQFEKALERTSDLVFECSPETSTTEEITLALEDLEKAVKSLTKFWNEKLKDTENE